MPTILLPSDSLLPGSVTKIDSQHASSSCQWAVLLHLCLEIRPKMLSMPKGREEELWHPDFRRVPDYNVKRRQNSSPNVDTACFLYCSHQLMSLADNTSNNLFQDGLIVLEIYYPKQKPKLLIVSQFAPPHSPRHLTFKNIFLTKQELNLYSCCPLTNGKSFRFLLFFLAYFLNPSQCKETLFVTT